MTPHSTPPAFEDYHTHHWRCGHASGTLAEVVDAARARRLAAVGLSDHAPMLHLPGDHPMPGTAMPRSAFDGYVREMVDLRDATADLAVRVGVEADYFPDHVDAYRDLLARHPWDHVLGSVHFVDGWHFVDRRLPPGATADDVWDRALVLTAQAATCGLFDAITHLDVIKTRGHVPREWVTPRLHETLDAIRDADVALELNTSGWRKPVGECFPGPALLREAVRRGIPIVLGSDAHRPQDVGADFGRAARLLREAGATHVAGFARRERTLRPLPPG